MPLIERAAPNFVGKLIDVGLGAGSAFSVDQLGNVLTSGRLKSTAPGVFVGQGGGPPVTSSLVTHLTSATVSGNDSAGTITLVTDATGIAINITLCVVTFANATLYAAAPIINLVNTTPGTDSTALFSGTYAPITISATAFSIVNLGHALTASGTFTLAYQVLGTA